MREIAQAGGRASELHIVVTDPGWKMIDPTLVGTFPDHVRKPVERRSPIVIRSSGASSSPPTA